MSHSRWFVVEDGAVRNKGRFSVTDWDGTLIGFFDQESAQLVQKFCNDNNINGRCEVTELDKFLETNFYVRLANNDAYWVKKHNNKKELMKFFDQYCSHEFPSIGPWLGHYSGSISKLRSLANLGYVDLQEGKEFTGGFRFRFTTKATKLREELVGRTEK